MTTPNNDFEDDEEEVLNDKKKPSQSFAKTMGTLYEFYLTGEIGDASKYTEWFNQIRHADKSDLVKLYINSPGGDMFTAIQFIRAMKESGAKVQASVEGACMSAATIIFLMSDDYEVTPHSMFMFHNYSSAAFGKGGEMKDQIKHEASWSEKLLREIYKDFLTDAEVKQILENKDIWMDSEEVVKRLNKRKKLTQQRVRRAKTVAPAAQ
jgi:ATP-dependent protease ClpP protease subunit